MLIREYVTSDCKQLAELFYQTVHVVNAKDYTKEQLDVWATGNVDLKEWDKSFSDHYTIVAIEDEITAKPFFEQRGFYVVKKQEVIRGGIALTNYVMEKDICQSAWNFQ